MAFSLISLVLLLPYILLLFYYRTSWLQLRIYEPKANPIVPQTFISVIIAARNEEKNIGSCIESIMRQTYPGNLFELIVVNDYSDDSTAEIVLSFKADNIRLLNLSDYPGNQTMNSYKKKAMEMAIGLAKGNLIVTTDADCIVQPKWLEIIAAYYEEFHPVFIAAPVAYTDPLKNDSLLKKFFAIFQSLDFITLQGITCASVYKKFHNMCNGANLAYEKKVFQEVGGFSGIDEIASGDDMLLMHKIQKIYPERIAYLKSPETIVQTHSAGTISEFMNQRIRWASKADRYPDVKITAVLVLVYILNAWIFLIGVLSVFKLTALYTFLVLLGVKTIAELIFLLPVARFFMKQKLLWLFFPAQPFHIIYTLVAGWLGKFGSYKWKGRKVK